MTSMRTRVRLWLFALLTLLSFTSAFAQEAITYTYDARARLTGVGRCGAINNGLSTNYGYDPADNRSNVTAGPAGATTLGVSPATLPAATIGTAYNQPITATGGSGGYSYSLSTGSLPAGLSLNSSTGVVSGTPTAAGTSTFTIQARDCVNNVGSRSYSVTTSAAALSLSPATLPAGTVGSAYSQTVTASGGSGTYSYSVSSGSLPSGLSLNGSTGAISGTPQSGGTYNFTITATDSSSQTGSRSYALAINLSLIPASLPSGTVGTAYNQRILTSGGAGGIGYAVSAGGLPTGLSFNNSTGAISGTPSAANTYAFTITATDSLNNTGSRSYTIPISLSLTPASLPGGTYGSAYSQQITASGGSGSYTYTAGSGTPPGLTLSTAGLLSGTPTSAGTYNFTVTANDSAGHTGSRSYSVVIALSVAPASLPNAGAGIAYTQTLTAGGGNGSYTFRSSAGTVPPGLAVIGTGSISGTPTTTGTYSFTVTVTDSAGNTGSRAYTMVVELGVSPASLPGGTVGAAYSQQITASGGSGSYSYTLGSGAPPGLTLSSAGLFSGTPTTAGTYNFNITANDTAGNTGSRSYSVVIGASATCGGVAFSIANTNIGVGAPLVFTITKTGSTTITCTVNYATQNGTAIAGTDYTAKSGTLSFTSSQTSGTVSVTTIDSGASYTSVKMYLNLSSPSGGATLTNTQATGTIKKTDSNPCPLC